MLSRVFGYYNLPVNMCTTYSRPPCRRKLEHALPLDINNRWRSLSDSDMFTGNGRAVFGILCFREGPPRDESDRRATDVQLSLLPRWFLLAPLDCVLVIIFPLAISFKVCSSPSQASDAWPCTKWSKRVNPVVTLQVPPKIYPVVNKERPV